MKLPGTLDPLVERSHWIVWRWASKKNKNGEEKRTKVPYQPGRPQVGARANDPSTWGDYATAVAVAKAGRADGIGFCLYQTDIVAFDLDDCRDPGTGKIAAWAERIVQRSAAYTEVTI